MLLDPLLPRDFDPSAGNEGVTLLHNLFTRIHLERRTARALGWRGFLPSNAGAFAWTARIARSDWIYGIVFAGEEADAESLVAIYSLYAFPSQESQLENLPQEAKTLFHDPKFNLMIRELAKHHANLDAFRVGQMTIGVRLDKTGLSVALETPKPSSGEVSKNFRPLRKILPLFSCIVSTFGEVLKKPPRLNWLKGPTAYLEASFGAPVFEDDEEIPKRNLHYVPLAYVPDEIDQNEKPIIHILCGFLGAGKTTFLQNWLNFLHSRERFTGVIQNEFGEIDLDAAIIGAETKVEALNEGCVCCTLADSLRPGILRLIEQTPAEQFILETTGLANPDNVLHSLDELKDVINPGLVVTIIDAVNLLAHPEYLKEELRLAQIKRADVLMCSKVELCSPEAVHELDHQLEALNPDALIMHAENGFTNFAVLDSYFNFWLDRKYGDFTSWKRDPEHDHMLLNNCGFRLKPSKGATYETFVWNFDKPVSLEQISALIKGTGQHVLRAKGIVDVEGKGRCQVQFTDGVITITKAQDDFAIKDNGLTIIGQNLIAPNQETTIRKERCL